jgi:hypothetical protein
MADRLYEVIEVSRGHSKGCPALEWHEIRLGKFDDGRVILYCRDECCPDQPLCYEMDREAARTLRDQLNEALGEKPAPIVSSHYPYTWKPLIWCQDTGTGSALPDQARYTCETKSE